MKYCYKNFNLKNSRNRSNTACRTSKCSISQVKDLGVASILNLKETNLWPVLRKKWKRESSLCVWDRLLFCVFYFVFVAGSKVRKKRMSSFLWGPRAEKKGEAIKNTGGNLLRSVQKFPSGHRRCRMKVSLYLILPVVEYF